MLSEIDPKLYPALATAVTAVLVAIVSAIMAIYAQRASRSTAQTVEALRAELAQHAKERDAARDYEYAARKRLYAECEPILFRLSEDCLAACRRIAKMAQPKAERLNLKADGHDRLATFYRLVAPLVEFTILLERLTAFDLGLDRRIQVRYHLGRLLVDAISEDSQLAAEEPKCSYDPGGKPGFLGKADPAVYLRQGIPPEDLEQLIEAMTCCPAQGPRVISFPSFKQSAQSKGALRDICLRLVPLVHNFEPRTRPVLWRVLAVQHALLTLISRIGPDPRASELDWSDSLLPPSADDLTLDANTARACRSYLSRRLKPLIDLVKSWTLGEPA